MTWPTPIKLLRTGPTTAVLLESVELFGVVIPEGYTTDGASVPRAVYNIIARFTDALPAALVHDIRYDPPENVYGLKVRALRRSEADSEFYRNLRSSGVSRRRAWLAYSAVRAGGWVPWNRGSKRGIIDK